MPSCASGGNPVEPSSTAVAPADGSSQPTSPSSASPPGQPGAEPSMADWMWLSMVASTYTQSLINISTEYAMRSEPAVIPR